jgi:hypothetical protein
MFSSQNSQVSNDANYIEDVFSTYLYTGTGATDNKITNNIDLATKGGMVWLKSRSGAYNNYLTTNATTTSSGGGTTWLYSNTTDALLGATGTGVCNFFTDGFDINPTGVGINGSGQTYASWTFRKQPKFFDIQTFTGNATYGGTFNHNLGSVPGCVIIKTTGVADVWYVWHRGTTGGFGARLLQLNATDAEYNTGLTVTATDTTVTIPNYYLNSANQTYVAYLFAHNAGGFGLTGTDNVISCGSWTGNATADTLVNLGWEPQWVLYKASQTGSSDDNWWLYDTMRGMTVAGFNALKPNLSDAEVAGTSYLLKPDPLGFRLPSGFPNNSGIKFIYIAIRRGPMKVPTTGTSVFNPAAVSTDINPITTNFPVDMFMEAARAGNSINTQVGSRLTGNQMLQTASTSAEVGRPPAFWSQSNTSYTPYIFETAVVAYAFRRAPSFFDEVCYTGGTGTPRVLNHNLATPPELVITKVRNFTGEDWVVHYNNGSSIIGGYLNSTSAFANSSTAPSTDITSLTSTTYTLNTSNRRVNGAYNYVAYLFATCVGVSKVGSYTGTGTTLQVNCGFTAGARFVLIKRTDSTGDWYVWDTARGIVSGNDPYLLLNSTVAEVTNTDYIDTYSAGFEISSTAPAAINASGGTFIFLAIA